MAINRTSSSSGTDDSVSMKLSRQQKQLRRLSILAENMNSLKAPPRTPGCVSKTLSSKSAISDGSHCSSSANMRRSTGWCLVSSLSFSSCPFMDVLSTGRRWVCLLGENLSFTSRSRCTAKDDIRSMGLSTCTKRFSKRFGVMFSPSLEALFSSDFGTELLMITRPAIERSLSNHVYQRPDPYGSTPTCIYPLLETAEMGFTFIFGLSVCAATILNPFPALYFPPTVNATSVL
mmetsp:Transcript_42862/g.69519  ORF Transcript_42862/g.69519 Transcript_42862/m.69519 type:complete len:233 (+) Transcript_42862:828-1526(+)